MQLTLFLLFLLSLNLHSATFRIRSKTINKEKYLYLKDVAAFYGARYCIRGTRAYLISPNKSMIFTANDRRAYIDSTKIYLSCPVSAKNNLFCLSKTDFIKFLTPIMKDTYLKKRRLQKIIIDPGHGGKDKGASGSFSKEKDIVLKISKKLVSLLKKKGYNAILTRKIDNYLSLKQRTKLANKANADLFLSLHVNAAGLSAKGVETFCLSPNGTKSTAGGKKKKTKQTGNNYDLYNARLAFEIQQKMLTYTDAEDRGIRHAYFQVLRDISCPAVLLEMGFVSCISEEKNLNNTKYQKKIIYAILHAIINFHKAIKK